MARVALVGVATGSVPFFSLCLRVTRPSALIVRPHLARPSPRKRTSNLQGKIILTCDRERGKSFGGSWEPG